MPAPLKPWSWWLRFRASCESVHTLGELSGLVTICSFLVSRFKGDNLDDNAGRSSGASVTSFLVSDTRAWTSGEDCTGKSAAAGKLDARCCNSDVTAFCEEGADGDLSDVRWTEGAEISRSDELLAFCLMYQSLKELQTCSEMLWLILPVEMVSSTDCKKAIFCLDKYINHQQLKNKIYKYLIRETTQFKKSINI